MCNLDYNAENARHMRNTDSDTSSALNTAPLAFSNFFHQSLDASLLIDRQNNKIIACNTSAEKALKGTQADIVGLTFADISAETQPCGGASPRLLDEKIGALAQCAGVRFEWVGKRLNSALFPCSVTAHTIEHATSGVLFISWVEISEMKRKEQELQNANDRLELAIKGADVGIWQWNLVSGELIWSDRLFTLLGYEPQEFSPSFAFWETIIHPEDAERVAAALKAHLENKQPYNFELRNQCKNGAYRWFKASGFAKRDEYGEPISMAGSLDDINEKKEAEIANKRLLELLDASSDFIGQADINKNLTYMNPAFKKLVGYGQKGRSDIPDWHPPEDLKKLEEVIFPEAIKHGLWQGEVNLIDTKGNTIPCSLLELAHKNSKGELETFSAIFRDISDLKKQEAELLKQTKISEHQSKLAAIGQLAAGVGHEINNPLAIIKGYVENSLSDLQSHKTVDPSKILSRLEKMNAAVDRISKITQGLRGLARNDVERAESFSLGDLIQESCSLVEEIYSSEGVSIQVSHLPDFQNTFLRVDKGKFQQVLMNLLANAKDAVEHSRKKDIHIHIKKRNNHVILEVEDSGSGMPDAILEHIFDPFYTTKDVNKGTGLGLSFVREYIEKMHGEIKVRSTVGEGTTFTIKFPEATNAPEQRPQNTEENTFKAPVRRLKILVVDDEQGLCEFYSDLLKGAGHKVLTSLNGEEALSVILSQTEDFDLIVSDMRMPIMGGLELAKAIRTNPWITQPRFLMTTGGVDVDLASDANEVKEFADGCLLKPFKASELLSTIEQLFS